MKKLLFLALLLTAGLTIAQDNSVPKKVRKAFATQYPSRNVIDWTLDLDGYRADFRAGSKLGSAWFHSDGTWILTEISMVYGKLPKEVTSSIEELYPDFEADQITLYEKPGESYYELVLSRGYQESYMVTVDPNGNILNETPMDFEEEEW